MPKISRTRKKPSAKTRIAKIAAVAGLSAATIFGSPKKLHEPKNESMTEAIAEKELKPLVFRMFPKNASWQLRNPAIGFPFQQIIDRKARKYSLDPEIAVRIPNLIITESWIDPNIVRGKDDRGLMQISSQLEEFAISKGIKVSDIFDPRQNIEVGVFWLSHIDKHLTVEGSRQKYLSLGSEQRMKYVFWAYRKGLAFVQKNGLSNLKASDLHYLNRVVSDPPFFRFNGYKNLNPDWEKKLLQKLPQLELNDKRIKRKHDFEKK